MKYEVQYQSTVNGEWVQSGNGGPGANPYESENTAMALAKEWFDGAERTRLNYRVLAVTEPEVVAEFLSCDYCGSTEEVDRIPDPFDADVRSDYTLHNICDMCAEERAREV